MFNCTVTHMVTHSMPEDTRACKVVSGWSPCPGVDELEGKQKNHIILLIKRDLLLRDLLQRETKFIVTIAMQTEATSNEFMSSLKVSQYQLVKHYSYLPGVTVLFNILATSAVKSTLPMFWRVLRIAPVVRKALKSHLPNTDSSASHHNHC